MKIENHKLSDFIKLDLEEIKDVVIALGYHRAEIRKPIRYLKLKHVEFVKKKIGSSNDEELIEVVELVQKLKRSEVMDMGIVRFFGIINTIRDQTIKISEAEENGLEPLYPDKKWEAVGASERMGKYGIYNTLRKLTGGRPWKFNKIMNMPYDEVFLLLKMEVDLADIEYEKSKIKD